MVDGTAALATMAGALVLLYLLIKGHLYVTRKLWKPVIEEEVAASEEGEEESIGEREEPAEERRPRGWDEVG